MVNVKKAHLQSGFNFLEMMVVLAIIVMILGFVGPKLANLLGRGRTTTTQNTLKVVGQAVQTYKMDVGRYPESLEELNNPPEGVQGYQGPYLDDKFTDQAPQDAWGEDLEYKKGERGDNPPFELYSEGDPDKDGERIDYRG